METLIVIGYAVAVLVSWFGMAWIGSYVSSQKGRSPAEGALLGLLLGPIGLVIAAVLPTLNAPTRKSRERSSRSSQPDYAAMAAEDEAEDEAMKYLEE